MDPQLMALLARALQQQGAPQSLGMPQNSMPGGGNPNVWGGGGDTPAPPPDPTKHHPTPPPPGTTPPPGGGGDGTAGAGGYTSPANPFSMPGVRLFGPSPVITPMFRHLFSSGQVEQYGQRQPWQQVSPTITDKGGLQWNIGETPKWWQQGAKTTWKTVAKPDGH